MVRSYFYGHADVSTHLSKRHHRPAAAAATVLRVPSVCLSHALLAVRRQVHFPEHAAAADSLVSGKYTPHTFLALGTGWTGLANVFRQKKNVYDSKKGADFYFTNCRIFRRRWERDREGSVSVYTIVPLE